MTVEMFLVLLLGFSTLSSIITEAIKKIFYVDGNITAFIISIVVGIVGTLISYQLCTISFTLNNIIYAILMGLAASLTSQVGYDKIKETIQKFFIGGKYNEK